MDDGMPGAGAQAAERHEFQAEVSRLLHLMVHSVYSEKEVFLRELVSNASDALEKLRHDSLVEPALLEGDSDLAITLLPDSDAKTLTISDNGIGMSREELVRNLGTIAHSGTRRWGEKLKDQQTSSAAELIGQFGVGFYAAFMVADRVTVTSRKAGEAAGHVWTSDRLGAFDVTLADGAVPRGTRITLSLKADEAEFLDPQRLKSIIRTYSDHVGYPIRLAEPGKDAEIVNTASALWMRPKAEISDDQYKEFYRNNARAFDDPWVTLHWRAEGRIEYTALLFVPSRRPFDLFDPAREGRIKLYARRVYITDGAELLPPWLRFMRGLVDSPDVPLNLSREMLQNNPLVAKIRQGLTSRVLGDLAKKAEKDPEGYLSFWNEFGAVVKEGLYEDRERRDEILKLARFRTTASGDGWRSLEEIKADFKENQTAFYVITGDDRNRLAASPQLEGFKARGVEVLLLTDPVDDFWIASSDGYDGKPFKSVTQGAADLALLPEAGAQEKPEAAPDGQLALLIAALKQTLAEDVADVRRSDRLTDSAVCLVAGDGGLDMHLERLLARGRDQAAPLSKRVLEINPAHDLIKSLAGRIGASGVSPEIEDAARLLFDSARIIEGEPLADPAAFARRLSAMMARAV